MNRSKKLAFVFAFAALLGTAGVLHYPAQTFNDSSLDSAVASRYPLRSRTPAFFARSKASNAKPNPGLPNNVKSTKPMSR